MADAGLSAADAPNTDIKQRQEQGNWLLWDGALLARATPDHLNVDWWRAQNRLAGEAPGRGAAAFLDAGEHGWVLRHYRRGGLAARVLDDQYLWLGVERSRAFREFRLMAALRERALPVPRPVAAAVQRHGAYYTADLLTERVPNATTVADRLAEHPLPSASWQRLGRTLARFHQAGAYHHDLNAHNILYDADGNFTLIDSDKGRMRPPGRWCEVNRKRLHRSLTKLATNQPGYNFLDADWQALLGGYLSAMSKADSAAG